MRLQNDLNGPTSELITFQLVYWIPLGVSASLCMPKAAIALENKDNSLRKRSGKVGLALHLSKLKLTNEGEIVLNTHMSDLVQSCAVALSQK